MSSDVLARVAGFFDKALELGGKGHLLRAAENYGRAAEAASALGADNLVALDMQLRQAGLLGGYALYAAAGAVDTAFPASRCCAEHASLLSSAIAALERRRAAGTLLDGKCAAAEEAWCANDSTWR